MAPPPVLKSRGDGPPPQQCSFRNTTPFCLKSPKLQKGGAPLKEGRRRGSALSEGEDLRFLKPGMAPGMAWT